MYAGAGKPDQLLHCLEGNTMQTLCGGQLQNNGSGNVWLVDADSCLVTETIHHTLLDTQTAVSELGKLLRLSENAE